MERARRLESLVRLKVRLQGDDHRVLALPSYPGEPEALLEVIRRVEGMDGAAATRALERVRRSFDPRHDDLGAELEASYRLVCARAGLAAGHAEPQRALIGAYFTMEFTLEAAALFNPSIVPHPDQSGAPAGGVRFLMSLRAVGEGHVSSVVFREGRIGADGDVALDAPPVHAVRARVQPDRHYISSLFIRKLGELGVDMAAARRVLDGLGERFTLADLDRRLAAAPAGTSRRMQREIRALADANHSLRLPPDCPISELVMFPASAYEARGIEDLRLVRFLEPGAPPRYLGTYTAYDGTRILPMLVETTDFHTVDVHTLNGASARGKGMALFPRRIGGRYVNCSRIDGRNLFLMFSDDIAFWQTSTRLAAPRFPWEFRLMGNCGSPIETSEGWLLLVHGVGPLRQYAIGALLLDLDDPLVIRGRLREPLITPDGSARGGYVPNVVYTCGALAHAGRLFIPYAVADEFTVMARVDVEELVRRVLADGP